MLFLNHLSFASIDQSTASVSERPNFLATWSPIIRSFFAFRQCIQHIMFWFAQTRHFLLTLVAKWVDYSFVTSRCKSKSFRSADLENCSKNSAWNPLDDAVGAIIQNRHRAVIFASSGEYLNNYTKLLGQLFVKTTDKVKVIKLYFPVHDSQWIVYEKN